MGTTLTGTTPQDTYDSLIKVTDNGPLSGTAKYLSDGLGNDSKLALSTGNIGIGTTSPSTTLHLDASGGATIRLQRTSASNNRFDVGTDGTNMEFNVRDTGAFTFGGGNVGIGTTPASKFHVAGADAWMTLQRTSGTTNILDFTDSAAVRLGYVGFISSSLTLNAKAGSDIIFAPNNGERGRFTSNGLTFNGDTAAANSLSDYEQGTWTMGITFGGGSTGVTTDLSTGTYTKIGRQVTVNGFLRLTNKGSSTGNARLTGLPFTVANTSGNLAAAALRFDSITFANQFQGAAEGNTTTIPLEEVTEAGVNSPLTDADFSNSCSIIVGCTYFV